MCFTGRSLDDLPYKAIGFPIAPLFALAFCTFVILGQGKSFLSYQKIYVSLHSLCSGYESFTPTFDGVQFVSSYIGIVPAVLCYVIYKVVRRTRLVPLDEVGMYANDTSIGHLLMTLMIDFERGHVTRFEIEQEAAEEKNRPWYKKVIEAVA